MPSLWHYRHDGQEFGPIPAADLKKAAASGQLMPSDLVWRTDMQNWVAAASIKNLFPSSSGGNSDAPAPQAANRRPPKPAVVQRSVPGASPPPIPPQISPPNSISEAPPVAEAIAVPSLGNAKEKNKTTAGICAILIGGLGVHKFYHGSWGWGIVYIFFVWSYIPALLGIIEGILYLTMVKPNTMPLTTVEKKVPSSGNGFSLNESF